MMSDDLSLKVLEYFAREFPHYGPLTMETSLKDSLLVDSITNLDLVVFLEEEFKIAITRRDILHHFDSPSSIVELVQSRRHGT